MYLTFLLLTLQVLSTTALEFYGGSMTFNSRSNFDGSYKVELRFKTAYHNCSSFDLWSCWSGNCGIENSFEMGKIDSSVNGGNWCQSEGIITRTVSTNDPFELINQDCCWIHNTVTGGPWSLLTHIDLGVRSDTSKPNKSPITTILPFLRVPQNCPRRFNLLAFDPDGDHVRCRYGLGFSNECGICNQPAGFTLDQNQCSLSYGHTSLTGVYLFELVLEDFPMQTITLSYTSQPSVTRDPFNNTTPVPTVPLSKIPLQFSVLVDSPALSCTEGEYLPQFLHPTPQHGEHLQARVYEQLEIRINAFALFSSITDVIISGPLNSTKHKATTGEYVINWTPTPENYGQHFPFCFIAEGEDGSNIYQSEMRCVIVEVNKIGPTTTTVAPTLPGPKAHVTCLENSMSVSVEKSTIKNINNKHLRLIDPLCQPNSNETHVFINIPLNGCGTEMKETNDNLIFKNKIISSDDHRDIITRTHKLEIEFLCKYEKRSNLTMEINFSTNISNDTLWMKMLRFSQTANHTSSSG